MLACGRFMYLHACMLQHTHVGASDYQASKRSTTAMLPCVAEVRQLLAHANQLLDAAAAEPQWLRAGERRFDIAAWRKLVPVAQLVATRYELPRPSTCMLSSSCKRALSIATCLGAAGS